MGHQRKWGTASFQTNCDQLLDPCQIADILNVKLRQTYKLIQSGIIPSFKIGRLIRVRPDDLRGFIESRAHKPSREKGTE